MNFHVGSDGWVCPLPSLQPLTLNSINSGGNVAVTARATMVSKLVVAVAAAVVGDDDEAVVAFRETLNFAAAHI